MSLVPVEAILRDGASVVIRSLVPSDRDQLIALFARMGPLSLRHRYCGAKRQLSDRELGYLTSPDGVRHVGLAAVSHDRVLGVGRYIRDDADAAEVAFDVGDSDQGRGIGTLLLEHLVRIARDADVRRFRALVEADNKDMLAVFENSGFAVRETIEGGQFEIEFEIAETGRFLAAATERERQAMARSIRVFFAPSSVAVIGVSRTPRTIGRAILDNLIRDGYRGPIYAVNPNANEVAGRRCYPSVASIGAPVDLAVIAVPARHVSDVVRECAAACVRGIVVISSGFAEAGGTAMEHDLRALVREAGMRMVGPNCLGVLSTNPAVSLDATFSPTFPLRGNVSLASQSGALGLMMLDFSRQLQLGIADFVSLGNKADVSVNDLLSYWDGDPRTRVIALYLESFGNPRTFARLAPRVAQTRPIIAVKSGRSTAGTRAACSHSASLACLDIGIDALFTQTGVIRTDTIEQLFDLASLLSSQPVPSGPRIGVLTNAGGPGILLADACESHGLDLPHLARETQQALRELLPAAASFANPIDMTASAPPAHFEAAIEILGRDPNVDSVVVIYVPPLVTQPDEIAAAIARGAGTIPVHKPIATVFMSSEGTPPLLAQGPRGAIPSYSFPENVAIALAAAVRYGRWRTRPLGKRLALTFEQQQAIRAHIATCGDGWLSLEHIAPLLAMVGVKLAEFKAVEPTPEAVRSAAAQLGFPCVVKAVAPGLVHKSEQGGVALDLANADEVAQAAAVMLDKMPAATQLIVQRQVPHGVEAIVGVASDPTLGPLLAAGIGGTAVELYKDVAFRVIPVTDLDANEMLDQLRGKPLLDGFRGALAADRAALVEVIQRVGALVESIPELVELDLNPVIVLEPGCGAIAADARLRLRKTNVAG